MLKVDTLKLLGPQKFEDIKGLLRRTFPEERCTFGQPAVDAFLAGLPDDARLAVCGVKLVAEELLEADLADSPAVRSHYAVASKHSRFTEPGRHSFVGRVPFVRVALPESGHDDIPTQIGMLYSGDRLYANVDQMRQKFGKSLGWRIGHVDLVTPARYPARLGALFAAVKVYLLFDTTRTLRAYVLEAGMATGEPMVAYFSPGLGEITRTCWYAPTPFSDVTNTYRGCARFSADKEFLGVDVDVIRQGSGVPHLQIRAAFTPGPAPLVHPSVLTAEAALRVAAIAAAMGRADPLMTLLAPFGRDLDWLLPPEA